MSQKPTPTGDEATDGQTGAAETQPARSPVPRRRFLAAGLSTTPIVMSLASRPVFGYQCSLSGFMSGNLSNHQQPPGCAPGYGCTPGFWKTHPELWQPLCGISSGRCSKVKVYNKVEPCLAWNPDGTCSYPTGNCREWDANAATGATRFDTIFGYSSAYGTTMMEVVTRHSGGAGSLDFHLVAAYLNACSASIDYGATPAQVVAAYHEAKYNARELELHSVLDQLNNRGCPINAFGECETGYAKNDVGECIPVNPVTSY